MKTERRRHGRKLLLLPLLLFALGVTGCGDDGDDGAPGAQGEPGISAADIISINVEAPESVSAEITGVTISSPPVVEFTVTDGTGRGVVGLEAGSSGNVRFTIAKLVPGGNGEPDTWQSYVNQTEDPTPGVGSATVAKTQATYDRSGTLEDHGDGSYTYTFATDIAEAVDPTTGAAITYDASLTHRVAIQFGGIPPVNPIYDFVPDGSDVSTMREIVAIESCNECHGQLALHGSGRIEAKYCVTCHNPGSTDANSGNTVDFPVMIHKIHMGHSLHMVEEGGEYAIYGFRDSKHDYSEVAYPQSVTNCRKCHNGEDEATPQGDNWKNRPTMEACGACHDNVNFADGTGHGEEAQDPPGAQADNSACAGCHGADDIEGYHLTPNATPNNPNLHPGQVNLTYEMIDATVNGDNQAVINFRMLADGVPLDPYNMPADFGSRWPDFKLAWAMPQDGMTAPIDYNNFGQSSGQATTVDIEQCGPSNNNDGTMTYAGGIATVTVTGEGLNFPVGATLRAVGIQGYFQQTVGEETYSLHTPSVVIPVTGDTARRQVVDNAKCGSCHEWLELHGGSRTYDTAICVMCHNPNLSSSGREIDDPNARVADVLGSDALTYPEATNNFKDMIHGIHAGQIRESDFEFVRNRQDGHYYNWQSGGGSNHPVHFPGNAANCLTCHLEGTYDLPVADGLLLTTNRTTGVADGMDATTDDVSAAQDSVPNDTDWVITPISAACYSCHDNDAAVAHMEQNGGAVNWNRSMVNADMPVETCVVCHGEGRTADVEEVHGVE